MHCPHCGSEIPAQARFCPECGRKVGSEAPTKPQIAPTPAAQQNNALAPRRRYANFEDVPFYRRSMVMHLVVLGGLWCPPLVIIACLIVLTGDIYKDSRDHCGNLRVWGVENKVAAVVLLFVYLGLLVLLVHLIAG